MTPDNPGATFRAAILEMYELAAHESALLDQAAATLDLIEQLQAATSDVTLPDGRIHPNVVELRQQRLALTRLVAAMRLPDDDTAAASGALKRPQRRGPRGAYKPRSA